MKRIFMILFKLWLVVTAISIGAAWFVYKTPEEIMNSLGYIDLLAQEELAGFDRNESRKQVEEYARQLKQKTGINFSLSLVEALENNTAARNIKIVSSKKLSGIPAFDRVISQVESSSTASGVRPVTLYFEARGIGQIGFTGLFLEGNVFSPSAMLGRSMMLNSMLVEQFSVMIVNEDGKALLSRDKKNIDAVVTLFYMPESALNDYFKERIEPNLKHWSKL